MKKFIALFIVVLLVIALMPVAVFAADIIIDLSIKGHGTTYTIENTNVTIVNTNSGPFYDANGYNEISILCEGNANLTLDGIRIDNSGIHGKSALKFTNAGNTLNLVGDCVLKAGTNAAGVWADGLAELEISGNGSLEAYGGANSAGIGGGAAGGGGYITIKSGTVTAQGGTSGAGIGGGSGGNGGNVVIEGGTVTATGGLYGAGIGGGENGDGVSVKIEGGVVTATGNGDTDSGGAGIGGGRNGDSGRVTIDNGTVIARGADNGAGIGGGSGGDGDIIRISNGVVTSTAGAKGAAIGGGDSGDGGDIAILGGVVTAISQDYGAGIGGGSGGIGGVILIAGGDVYAQCNGRYGAGIGGGYNSGAVIVTGGNITISGGDVTALGGSGAAGIGGGDNGAGGKIEIQDGKVEAIGADNGAGIGGGDSGEGGDIKISGGTVDAMGGDYAAGIGGGGNGDGGEINITNGNVKAMGGGDGSGIGGGSGGDGGDISISNAAIDAAGGPNAAGIGGGNNGDGGDISISNAVIDAQGGPNAAGIGGGSGGHGGRISILSGTINAVGNDGGAGIGGGKNGGGGIIGIYNGYVVATGGELGAGIGGGWTGDGGEISINNGSVFARKGAGGKHDIGEGQSGANTTLKISGDAGVFLYNDECAKPVTTHTHFGMTNAESGKLYGIEVPSGWGRGGAYIVACTLSYNANGGYGSSKPDVILHKGGVASAVTQGDLRNGLLAMVQWNSSRYGKGYGYFPGGDVVVTQDTTLYAIWKERDVNSVALSQNKLKMTKFQEVRLGVTVNPSNATNDVVWHSTNTEVVVVDQRGVVTAIGDGNALIVAQADGVRDTCEVLVKEKEEVSVALNPTEVVLEVGDDVVILAEITGDATVEWESTNPGVAIVSSFGLVEAISEGVTVIIARAGQEYDVCGVAVIYPEENYAEDSGDTEQTLGKDQDDAGASETGGAKKRFAWWWIPISIFCLGLIGMGAWVVMLKRR